MWRWGFLLCLLRTMTGTVAQRSIVSEMACGRPYAFSIVPSQKPRAGLPSALKVLKFALWTIVVRQKALAKKGRKEKQEQEDGIFLSGLPLGSSLFTA